MLKDKLKVIALLLTILLSIIAPISRAENEATTINEDPEANYHNEQNNTESQSTTEQNITNTSDEETQNAVIPSTVESEDSFKKSDIYLVGDNVTIDYVIDGNLFVCANSVTINSQIGGDAFIVANSITVEEQGYIYSNLFAASEDLNIKGVVYDVYSFANTVNISGYIYRDIKIGCSDLTISGVVGRNAFVDCNMINFTETNSESSEETIESKGSINGDLNYSAKNEISIPEGVVSGKTNFTKTYINEDNSISISNIIMTVAVAMSTTIVIWLLCIWLAPKFITKSQELAIKKTLPVIGIGILTPIVLAIVSIILLILTITVPVGLLAILLLISLLVISTSIFVITASYLICKKLNIETKIKQFGIIVVLSIILALIKLIPYIGPVIGFAASIIGLGLIVSSILIKNLDNTKNETKKEKAE